MNNTIDQKALAPNGKGSSGFAAKIAAGWGSVTKFLKPNSLEKRKALQGIGFVLPFIIGILFIYLPVIVSSIYYSCCTITPDLKGEIVTFVGFDHYRYALTTDPKFVQTLVAGLKQLIIDIPAIVIFSLFVAVVLNQKMLGRAAFRAIFFIPVILSTGLLEDVTNLAVDSMEGGAMNDGSGTSASTEIINAVDITNLLGNMKVGTEIVTYVVGLVNDIYNIVNRSGVQILIFLAALQSISPSIYEACTIDGATAWETFWKITLPMISPMILVNGLYTIIDSFTSASNVVMQYIDGHYGGSGIGVKEQATAMSWIYFVIVMLIIAAFAGIASAFVFYQKRDS